MSPLKYTQGLYDPTPVQAIYTPQEYDLYQGVPFIEALENVLTPQEVMDITGSYPPYSKNLRSIGDQFQRMSYVSTLLNIFRDPLPTDVILFFQLRETMCNGYIRNNPLLRGYWEGIEPELLEFYGISPNSSKALNFLPPTANGFVVPGDGGTGKSTTMAQIARIFRRMIVHGLYKGKIIEVQRQIPIVIVICPESGALRIFIAEFFHAVDAIAGTDYFRKFTKRPVDNSELKRKVTVVCRLHGIGAIVLDEAQNLVTAKRGFEKELLAFLTTFHDTVKVPLVLVGTPEFQDIWKESFAAGRRFLGGPPVEFKRFPLDLGEGSKFVAFCRAAWKYQLTRRKIPMTNEILEEVHDLTQGNPFLIKKALQFVQVYAIQWGKDDQAIGVPEFHKLRGKFGPVEEALETLRSGDPDLVAQKFKDLWPPEDVKAPKGTKKNDEAKPNEADNSKDTVSTVDSDSRPGATAVAKTENGSAAPIPNPVKGKSERARKQLEKESKQRLTEQDKKDKADQNYEDLKNQGLIGFTSPD